MKRLGTLLFALIIIYFIFLIRQDIINNLELKGAEKQTQINIGLEEKMAAQLLERSKDLKNNNYIEEVARTKLGLVKEGETAYKVILKTNNQ
jgi:cell division protein FtsB